MEVKTIARYTRKSTLPAITRSAMMKMVHPIELVCQVVDYSDDAADGVYHVNRVTGEQYIPANEYRVVVNTVVAGNGRLSKSFTDKQQANAYVKSWLDQYPDCARVKQ